MIVLYNNNIVTNSLSASSVDANYPVSNLLNDHVKHVWKGTTNKATLEFCATAGEVIALFGTNAITIKASVGTGSSIEWESGPSLEMNWSTIISWDVVTIDWISEQVSWEDKVIWIGDETVLFDYTYDLSTSSIGSLWINYPDGLNQTKTVFIKLTCAAGDYIHAGVLRAGDIFEMRDPDYGMSEKLQSYSIIKELNNGSFFFKKRESAREFGCKWEIDRDHDFYTFMYDIMRVYGEIPMAWRLSSTLTNPEWIVFARPSSMPSASHDYPMQSTMEIELIEAI